MTTVNEEREFEILGYKVRFRSGESLGVNGSEAVAAVKTEAEKILASAKHLDEGQAAILVALKIATEKIALEKDYQTNIHKLQSQAKDALSLIDEISPILN